RRSARARRSRRRDAFLQAHDGAHRWRCRATADGVDREHAILVQAARRWAVRSQRAAQQVLDRDPRVNRRRRRDQLWKNAEHVAAESDRGRSGRRAAIAKEDGGQRLAIDLYEGLAGVDATALELKAEHVEGR